MLDEQVEDSFILSIFGYRYINMCLCLLDRAELEITSVSERSLLKSHK